MPAWCPPSAAAPSNPFQLRNRTVSSRYPQSVAAASAPPGSSLGFLLFILVNAVLFVRPAEIYPELVDLPIYEVVILCCLVVSLPSLAAQWKGQFLLEQPVTVCVLGLLPAILLSHLSHGNLYSARWGAYGFAKVVVYYLLLVANINTVARLQQFMLWLVGLIAILTALALLQFHEVIDIPALKALQQRDYDPQTGEILLLPRLRSTGIFNDPNDLCLVLLIGMAISLYRLCDHGSGLFRGLFLLPMGLFIYALIQTRSRGGFIGLLVGLLVLLRFRYGWWKTIALSALGLPLLFMIFSGRQTRLDIAAETGQGRIQYWSEGILLFREAPFFGIGKDEFAENVHHVAHNSFVHSFVELGFFGGMLFLGAFFCSTLMLYRFASPGKRILDPQLHRFCHYLMAMVAASVTGLMALSRGYVVNTYLILGLVTAYVRIVPVYPPGPVLRFDWRLLSRLALASLAFMIFIYTIVRIFARWGG
jgi:hypothetical protein